MKQSAGKTQCLVPFTQKLCDPRSLFVFSSGTEFNLTHSLRLLILFTDILCSLPGGDSFLFWIWEKYLLQSYYDFNKIGVLSLGGWSMLSALPGWGDLPSSLQEQPCKSRMRMDTADHKDKALITAATPVRAMRWIRRDWMREQTPLVGNSMARQRSRNYGYKSLWPWHISQTNSCLFGQHGRKRSREASLNLEVWVGIWKSEFQSQTSKIIV